MRRFVVPSLALALVALACSSGGGAPSDDATKGPASDPSTTPANPNESPASKDREKDPTTSIVVGIDSEDFRSDGYGVGGFVVTATVDGAVAAMESVTTGFPHELRITAPKDKPDAAVRIDITVYDGPIPTEPNGRGPLVKRTLTTRFVPGKTKLAYAMLEVRCNILPLGGFTGVSGPTCQNPGETCIAGKCMSDVLADLPDYVADWAKHPPSQCGEGTASAVELGVGERSFTALEDGATVQIEMGGQCGHHIWLGVRMKDLGQRGVTTTLSATQPGSTVKVPLTAYPYSYGPSGDGHCELAGLRFQVDLGGSTKVADFLGKPLDITLDVKDKQGRHATITKHVNVAPTKKGDFPQCNAASQPPG